MLTEIQRKVSGVDVLASHLPMHEVGAFASPILTLFGYKVEAVS